MQFEEAIAAAHRLAADGRGAEVNVIVAALAERIADLEYRYSNLVKECNQRQDGVLLLSETTKNQMRGLRNRICQIDGMMDAHEKELFRLKRNLPPPKRRAKREPKNTEE